MADRKPAWMAGHVSLGILIALLSGCVLYFLAYLMVALGFPQDGLEAAAWVAPLLGVAFGAAWAGARAERPRRAGTLVALGVVLLWLLGWCFLMGRCDVRLWVVQGLGGLTVQHLIAWGATVLVGWLGGGLGGRETGRKRLSLMLTLLYILPISMLIAFIVSGMQPSRITLAPGATLQRSTSPTGDGTTLTLITLDFKKNPNLYLGLYDTDSADASPGDDRDATWLGQSIRFALPKMQRRAAARDRRVLFACNGGFFSFEGFNNRRDDAYNLRDLLVGFHIIPIAADGKVHYFFNKMRFQDQVWHFGINKRADGPRFTLTQSMDPAVWAGFETAIGGVRPLIMHWKPVPLAPGNGNTTLKCSRTSIGWNKDGSRLYILIGIDPDGEYSSVAQRSHGRQTGGMNLRDLQLFWEKVGVPEAVLFDGGDSTQCAYRLPAGGYAYQRSGFLLSKTLGHLRSRPLRFAIPMLPPGQSYNGVMNYLYVGSK